MIALDTDVLVRDLAQGDARQSALATALVEKQLSAGDQGFVSLEALLEAVWVMQSCDGADAATVPDILADLLDTDCFDVQDEPAVRRALAVFRDGKVDLHDCLIAALAEQRNARVVTFDAQAARRPGMELLR